MMKVNYLLEEQMHQGDIIRTVEYIQKIEPMEDYKFKITSIEFPLVIVLTQECDLELDYKARKGLITEYPQDKMLMSVIVAPVYNAEQVFIGEHLKEIDNRQMQSIFRDIKDRVKNSEVPRYYFLKFHPDENINDLIIDFKHYFSVDVDTLGKLKANNFEFSIPELYREDISLKFANYLGRIGLPT